MLQRETDCEHVNVKKSKKRFESRIFPTIHADMLMHSKSKTFQIAIDMFAKLIFLKVVPTNAIKSPNHR